MAVNRVRLSPDKRTRTSAETENFLKLVNRTAKYRDGAYVNVTYFQIIDTASSTDVVLDNVFDNLTNTSPLKYRRIEAVPMYGVDTLQITTQYNDAGLTSMINQDGEFQPDTVVPVAGDFFEFDLPQLKNPRYVQSDVLNMRSAPGTNSKIIDRLINGTEVNYTGNKTEEIDGHLWAEITYDGKTGWVAADHLMIEKPDTVPFDSGYAKNYSYDAMEEALTKTDLDAGIKISESSNSEYYYDYTDVIMNRVNEALLDFLNHKIMSYPEYYKKISNWLYSPTLQEYYAFYLKDYVYFYNQVKPEAPWDVKIDDSWKQQFGDIRMPYYFGDSDIDEKFLFRGEEVSREDLGNILYGYLGSAMGIGDTTLYQGAGVAASWTNIFDGDLYDASAYYGDNPHDHEYVKKGIEMFYEDYPEAKT